ncbi:MAG: coenzyme F420-0:L-glutamate ligase [Promethearchaeati archaeon SRVP18_Atabeyarchaeia-1]
MRTGNAELRVEIMGIEGIPEIKSGDDLSRIVSQAAEKQGTPLKERDIIVVTSKIVSLAEGKTVDLRSVEPSHLAKRIATESEKDPRQVEVILREAKSIVRMSRNHLIVETKHGFVCANAGVDKSNVKGENMVATLPDDPDRSCKRIRDGIRKLSGIDVAVVLADTFGRSLRRGVANVAIGVAGLAPILDLRGTSDMYGYKLRVTQIAVADELASSAELVMGKTNWIPAVIIRGYKYEKNEDATAKILALPEEEDIFR